MGIWAFWEEFNTKTGRDSTGTPFLLQLTALRQFFPIPSSFFFNPHSQFPKYIIHFLRSKTMIFPNGINLDEDEQLFLYSSHLKTEDQIDVLEPASWIELPQLQRGDSMFYISQFLSLAEEEPTTATKEHHEETQPANNGIRTPIFSKSQTVDKHKRKKISKLQNSPFHNYQKHLNNALKKMILVPLPEDNEDLYKKVAHQLWIKYFLSDIKTKKILHSVFNERNEHQSSEAELRVYDFWELYQTYGEKMLNMAKDHLSRIAIEQINETSIDCYLLTRKFKKREGFKEYILQFRQELSNGFLKRRTNLEQTQK